jgi:hypothetical protein
VKVNQETDFRCILNTFLQLGDQRDKLIVELDEIIDRIKQNRRPLAGEAKRDANTGQKIPDDVISTLKERLGEMDVANERLNFICVRLNELV